MKKKRLLIIRSPLLIVLAAILALVLSCGGGDEDSSAKIVEVVADVQAHARSRDDWVEAMDRRARVQTHRRG